jgi:hypothetical protein
MRLESVGDHVLSHLRTTAPKKELEKIKDDIQKHHCTIKIREIKLVLCTALLEEGAAGDEGQTSLRTLVFIFFFLLFLEI